LSRQRKGFGLKATELSAVVLLAGMVLYFAIHHLNGASGPLGRDSTLTGRTELWHYSLGSAVKHPILGYGYRAFWNVSPEADRIRQVIGWDAPHAHNAYIESVLGLGVIGLTMYLIASFVAIKRAIVFARFEQGKERSWPLAFLVFTLLYGLTEAPPMSPNNLLWILFVAAACVVCRVPAYRTVPRWSETDQTYKGQLVMQH
jgi:exopolysaccharide production protein ExoQ